MKELLKNFYGFHTYCGDLFIYGDNMEICKPYLNDIKVESIEEVLEYCKEHKLRAYLYPKRSIKGIIGFISTYFSAKKMGGIQYMGKYITISGTIKNKGRHTHPPLFYSLSSS